MPDTFLHGPDPLCRSCLAPDETLWPPFRARRARYCPRWWDLWALWWIDRWKRAEPDELSQLSWKLRAMQKICKKILKKRKKKQWIPIGGLISNYFTNGKKHQTNDPMEKLPVSDPESWHSPAPGAADWPLAVHWSVSPAISRCPPQISWTDRDWLRIGTANPSHVIRRILWRKPLLLLSSPVPVVTCRRDVRDFRSDG